MDTYKKKNPQKQNTTDNLSLLISEWVSEVNGYSSSHTPLFGEITSSLQVSVIFSMENQ